MKIIGVACALALPWLGIHFLTAVDTGKRAIPMKGTDLLPLPKGASWTYRFTNGATGTSCEYRYEVAEEVPVDGGTCTEIKAQYGDPIDCYEYWAARNDGIYLYHQQGMVSRPGGVDPSKAPYPTLTCPPRVGASWEWSDVVYTQTMFNDPPGTGGPFPIQFKATIESVDDSVTVPAGTFRAVRVKTVSTGFLQSEETFWFASGVGIVKRLRSGRSGDGPYLYELLRR